MDLSTSDFRALENAGREASIRTAHSVSVQTITWPESGAGEAWEIVEPGSIALFASLAGSEAQELLDAATRGEWVALGKLDEIIRHETAKRRRVSVSRAVAQMVEGETFFEVTHAGRRLAANLYLPKGVSCVPIVFPFTGGALENDGVRVTCFLRPGAESGLVFHAFSRTPDDLSPEERQALSMLPDDDLSLNAGAALCYALTAVTFAAAVCATTGICCPHLERLPADFDDGVPDTLPPWMTDGADRSANPASTVAALLHRRSLAMRHR